MFETRSDLKAKIKLLEELVVLGEKMHKIDESISKQLENICRDNFEEIQELRKKVEELESIHTPDERKKTEI